MIISPSNKYINNHLIVTLNTNLLLDRNNNNIVIVKYILNYIGNYSIGIKNTHNQFFNLLTPKISITYHEKSGKRQVRPSLRKIKKIINSSLKSKSRFNVLVTFKVVYGKFNKPNGKTEVIDNQITTKNPEDLKWAFKTFLEKGLWLKK
jgi:hypothetical protein